jgi:hypothetical protein
MSDDEKRKPREWESMLGAAQVMNALAERAREEGFDVTFHIYGDGELGNRGEMIAVQVQNYGEDDPFVATSDEPLQHVGLHAERTANDLLEAAFAEEWRNDNEPRIAVQPILPALVMRGQGGRAFAGRDTRRPAFRIDQRDATIAATVVQWLGSNIGRDFLDRSLKRVGVRIEWRGAQLRPPALPRETGE